VGGDEEGSKLSKPLKIEPAVFVKLVSQVIQVGNTIFDDSDPLGIEPFRAIEEIYDASADHGIQCHQRPLVLASHLRPPFLLVSFPERRHGIPAHNFRSPSIQSGPVHSFLVICLFEFFTAVSDFQLSLPVLERYMLPLVPV